MANLSIKSVDLFSLPFRFSLLNDDKQKKTLCGGYISLIIICLALIYFLYLCYLYFGNQMQPSITSLNVYFNEPFEMDINSNFLAFRVILQDGQDLTKYKLEEKKVYLSPLAVVYEKYSNGIEKETPIDLVECSDKDNEGFHCLDYSSFNQNRKKDLTLSYIPGDVQKKIKVFLLYCTPSLLPKGYTCATREEIRQQVVRSSTQLILRVTSQQFNPNKRQFEKKVKQEQYLIAEGLVYLGRFLLQKETTIINEGFLIQSEKQEAYFAGYTKSDFYNTFEFLKQELNMELIGLIDFYLSESGYQSKIQFPQFTSLLAQFSSVFQSLLIAGFLCKKLSESEMVQDLVEIHLKYYYKRSAIDLIQIVERKKQEIDSSSSNTPPSQSSSDIFHLYRKIQSMDYKYYMNKYLQNNFLKKIKLFFFPSGSKQVNQNDSQELTLYKKLISSTCKSISIYDIQKDLLKIKMMLRMIFTVEQYAAMQLCGLRIEREGQEDKIQFEEQHLIKKDTQKKCSQQTESCEEGGFIKISDQADILENEKYDSSEAFYQKQLIYKEIESQLIEGEKQNHLEKIEFLEKDNNYFERCVDRFLNKNQFQSQLDQRILECMIGTQQMKSKFVINGLQSFVLDKSKQQTQIFDRSKQQTLILDKLK